MYSVCETFVGAGGSHLGFKNNGFKSVYVNDISHEAMTTLLNNNPDIGETAIVDERSIVDINPKEILVSTGLAVGELDVLFGGIVCKGFSLAGQRSPNDERNYFYRKQLEFVKVLRPKVSIIENVPGIQNARVLSNDVPEDIKHDINVIWQSLENYKGEKAQLRKENRVTEEFELKGKDLRKQKDEMLKRLDENNYLISVMDDLLSQYEKLGYTVYKNILNSACYGSATKRERIIIVAVRGDIDVEYSYPTPTHGSKDFSKKYSSLYDGLVEYEPLVTVNDVLDSIDYSDVGDIDNKPMNHAKKTVERLNIFLRVIILLIILMSCLMS